MEKMNWLVAVMFIVAGFIVGAACGIHIAFLNFNKVLDRLIKKERGK